MRAFMGRYNTSGALHTAVSEKFPEAARSRHEEIEEATMAPNAKIG